MKPSTLSLFEQEMHDQVAAARDAVLAAEGRSDPLLLQAAQSHLESLVDLARRNGVAVDDAEPAGAPSLGAPSPDGAVLPGSGLAGPEPLAAPAV